MYQSSTRDADFRTETSEILAANDESGGLQAAIIVPTLNERANVLPLLAALDGVLREWRAEIIFVDDWSDDGTAELIGSIARARSDVRLIRRFGRNGLASAVLEGMLSTTAEVVAVIDADMQHDEGILPELLRLVDDGDADVAVGSRYCDGGSIGEWNSVRARASGMATRMAQLALKLSHDPEIVTDPAGALTDPMSGFFAVRRANVLDALPRMSGKGFKVLLDLLLSSPRRLRVAEAPYTFRGRVAGASKLGPTVCLQYLQFIAMRLAGRLLSTRLLRFGAVGAAGLVVQLALLRALSLGGVGFGLAQMGAVIGAIAFNFFANNAFTWRDRQLTGARLLPGLTSFYAVCGIGAVANIAVAQLSFIATHTWWLASVAGAVAGSFWNYGASSLRTWKKA